MAGKCYVSEIPKLPSNNSHDLLSKVNDDVAPKLGDILRNLYLTLNYNEITLLNREV